MTSYFNILSVVIVAWIVGKFILSLVQAFTGPLSKIPGPWLRKVSSLPHKLSVIQGKQNIVVPELVAKYGHTYVFAPGGVVVVGKTAYQKVAIEENMKKGPIYEKFRQDPHVQDIFTATDKDVHKQRRRMLSPGFSISYLNGLEPLMQGCVQEFEDVLNAKIFGGNGSAVVDISNMMSNLTVDVISATAFGGSFGVTRTNDTALRDVFKTRLMRVQLFGQLPFLRYLPFMPDPEPPEMELRLKGILKTRRNLEKNLEKKDLLQILMDRNREDPKGYPDKVLMEDMRIFMLAGSDTSSNSLTFTILLLLNNPYTLKDLVQELVEKFPSKDDPITFESTQSLPYLNAVINESMRVIPVTSGGAMRQAEKDCIINDYEIPAETIVLMYINYSSKDPRIWPDPDSFVPERWLGKYKGADADPASSIPFSIGHRNCIGQQFALKEMRIILATLVRRYELILVPNQSHETRAFFTSALTSGKYMVEVKQRS